jgi:hypothetical protein
MCKELPVIPVNKVVDQKRKIGKMEGRGGGEAQGVADQKNLTFQNQKKFATFRRLLYQVLRCPSKKKHWFQLSSVYI